MPTSDDPMRSMAFLICQRVDPHPEKGTCSVQDIFFEGSAPQFPAGVTGYFFACLASDPNTEHQIEIRMVQPGDIETLSLMTTTIRFTVTQERNYLYVPFEAVFYLPGRYIMQLWEGESLLAESPLVLRLQATPG